MRVRALRVAPGTVRSRQRATGTLAAGHTGRTRAVPSGQTAHRAGRAGHGRAECVPRRAGGRACNILNLGV
jgi:hypothetical protein